MRLLVSDVRVRFAPSPTGSLHLGGLRTALINYLFAKKNKGRIILRLEDTDKYRNVPKSAEGLAKTFDDLGICFDESPSLGGIAGPYVQSQRLHLYQDYSQRLLKMGSAYKCFCSKERLKVLSAGSIHPGGYDGRCRMLTRAEVERKTSQGLPFTIRLKVKENGTTDVRDEVYGIVTFSNALLDDQILLRSDGFPTYHFANVVDDHLMNISHVIRGEEWLSSTPKHIQLYQAFGWTPPVFVHLPLLLRKEGKGKLSKRDSSMSVDAYLRKGYLPVSLLNFVGLLGWAPHTGQEIMTLPQMINAFSLADLNKASPRVDVDRLKWINKQHCDNLLSSSADSQPFISDLIACIVAEYGDRIRGEVKENLLQSKYVASVANLVKERTQLMPEMVREMEYFFVDPQMSLETGSDGIREMLKSFTEVDSWTESKIVQAIDQLPCDCKMDRRKVLKILRSILTGTEVGPALKDIILALGRDTVCERIKYHLP